LCGPGGERKERRLKGWGVGKIKTGRERGTLEKAWFRSKRRLPRINRTKGKGLEGEKQRRAERKSKGGDAWEASTINLKGGGDRSPPLNGESVKAHRRKRSS